MTDFVDVLHLPYGAPQTDYRPGPDAPYSAAAADADRSDLNNRPSAGMSS